MHLDDFARRFQWLDTARTPDSPLAAMKPCHELDRLHINHPVWDQWLQQECRALPFLEPDSPVIQSILITAMALYAMPNTTRKHSRHGNITMLDFAGGGRALAPSMLLAPDPDLERHLVCAGGQAAHADTGLASAIAGIPGVTNLESLADLPLDQHNRVSALILTSLEHAPEGLAPLLVNMMPIMTWNGRILLSGQADAVTRWQLLVEQAGGNINCRARFDWQDSNGSDRSFALYTPFAAIHHHRDFPGIDRGDIWRATLFEDLNDSEKVTQAPSLHVDTRMDMVVRGGDDPAIWTPPTGITLAPLELAHFSNATLFAYGMVATEDGRLFAANMRTHELDALKRNWQESNIGANLWHNRLGPVAEGHYRIGYDLSDCEEIDQAGFLIGFQSGSDYTHFFWDVLPRLHLLDQVLDPNPLIILTGAVSGWQKDILTTLGIAADRIIAQGPGDKPRRFKSLWVPSFPGMCNHAIRPEGVALLQSLKKRILKDTGPVPDGLPKRLFLTRKTDKSWVRRHLNERAIEAQLANHGFVPIDTAGLSLLEKAQLFDQAECLAGAYGGAWAHAFFCQPGTKLMPFNTVDYPAPGGAVLADVMEFQCKTVMGDTLRTELDPSNSPFLIDPTAIDYALEALKI